LAKERVIRGWRRVTVLWAIMLSLALVFVVLICVMNGGWWWLLIAFAVLDAALLIYLVCWHTARITRFRALQRPTPDAA
jgi:hypothetical protein